MSLIGNRTLAGVKSARGIQTEPGGGNVCEGYKKLIFAVACLSVIIASGADMPQCPACRIICRGNEV